VVRMPPGTSLQREPNNSLALINEEDGF
jgi:hypothetical protein